MLKKRLIAIILVKDEMVIQSENFYHTNVIHYDPEIAVKTFSEWSVDEIFLINVSKKKNEMSFIKFLNKVSKKCFVPLTVGGWIDNFEFAEKIFQNGADKISINTAFYNNFDLIKKITSFYGKQSLICSIDYKINKVNYIKKVFVDRGTKGINYDPISWVKKNQDFCGEILLTSIDKEGMRSGYDLDTLKEISDICTIPIIVFGGANEPLDFLNGFKYGADAVAAANFFHYKEFASIKINKFLLKNNIIIRKL